jgi:serine/threonine protein kinase
MSNGDLLTLLKNDETKSINVSEMVYMVKQASAGMAYLGNFKTLRLVNFFLEEKKIVHRDLALRNILVTSSSDSHYSIKVTASFKLKLKLKRCLTLD